MTISDFEACIIPTSISKNEAIHKEIERRIEELNGRIESLVERLKPLETWVPIEVESQSRLARQHARLLTDYKIARKEVSELRMLQLKFMIDSANIVHQLP
ncbi:MAG: hypothetical protein KDK78_11095 [Chlamydiia bacterium]|nr:hypothetical protein [Chlamydiia bacterium]